MKQKIGVLGSGNVGQALANGLKDLGYEVTVGSRTGKVVDNWDGAVGTFTEVAKGAELVILAVKGAAAAEVVGSIKSDIGGKTVMDTTNPISDEPPVDGVLNFFTSLDEALIEQLQKAAPEAKFVKAFNSVGSGEMVKPQFKEGKPSMFICGNDETAKAEVSDIVDQLGWEVADMGTLRAARAIEPLCMLWCIPGIRQNDWAHAFKLLKQ